MPSISRGVFSIFSQQCASSARPDRVLTWIADATYGLTVHMPVEEAFGRALAEMWLRDGIQIEEPFTLAHAVAVTFARGASGPAEAGALLARSGVRAQWNRVLCHDRSRVLASRIGPLVAEPLLDVLAGDGSICEALSAAGFTRLSATERRGEYDNYGETRLPAHVEFQPFSEDMDLAPFGASTALVSAVLHHERAPSRLLDALAHADIPRWIVVENCITPEFSPEFHAFADRFFNTCLNDIGVHCGDEHRALTEWVALLAAYGTVTVVAESFAVPGIPFPYSLLVVDRTCHGKISRPC